MKEQGGGGGGLTDTQMEIRREERTCVWREMEK